MMGHAPPVVSQALCAPAPLPKPKAKAKAKGNPPPPPGLAPNGSKGP